MPPELANSVMDCSTPTSPLPTLVMVGLFSSLRSPIVLPDTRSGGGGAERRQVRMGASRDTACLGGCCMSPSRESNARHLSMEVLLTRWMDWGREGVTSQFTSTRITLTIFSGILNKRL